jgi:hypothetical protein
MINVYDADPTWTTDGSNEIIFASKTLIYFRLNIVHADSSG